MHLNRNYFYFRKKNYKNPQETIGGVLVVSSNSEFKHDGISLMIEGCVNLQISSKNVGILEAFYNSVKVSDLVLFYLCVGHIITF